MNDVWKIGDGQDVLAHLQEEMMPQYASQAPIVFTANTREGDELVEWADAEVPQYAVALNREWRGLNTIAFHFETPEQAHALFMALCEAKKILVQNEEID